MAPRRLLSVLVLFVIVIALIVPTAARAGTGGLDLYQYCRSRGYVDLRLVNNTVYGWTCVDSSGNTHGMDLADACRWQYGGNAIPKFTNFNDANSWYCDNVGSSGGGGNPSNSNGGNSGGGGHNGGGSDGYEHVLVQVSRLYVRQGPGTQFRIIGAVGKCTELTVYERSGSWIRTNAGGWSNGNYTGMDC